MIGFVKFIVKCDWKYVDRESNTQLYTVSTFVFPFITVTLRSVIKLWFRFQGKKSRFWFPLSYPWSLFECSYVHPHVSGSILSQCGRYSSCLGCSWLLCTAATLPLITVKTRQWRPEILRDAGTFHSSSIHVSSYKLTVALNLDEHYSQVISKHSRTSKEIFCGIPVQKISRNLFSLYKCMRIVLVFFHLLGAFLFSIFLYRKHSLIFW